MRDKIKVKAGLLISGKRFAAYLDDNSFISKAHMISPYLLFAAVNEPFKLSAAGYLVEFFAAEHAEVYCKDAVYAYAQSHG